MVDHQECFADVLREVMRLKQHTPGLLADRTGIPEDTIKTWLKGRSGRVREWQRVVCLAAALELSETAAVRLLSAAGAPQMSIHTEALASWLATLTDQAVPAMVLRWIETLAQHRTAASASARIDVPAELKRHLHDHTGFMQDRLASFVGRADELREVRRLIAELLPTGGYVTITAQAGQGKSSLIAKLVELALRERWGVAAPEGVSELAQHAGPAALAYHFIPFSPGPDHQVGLLRNLMTRLILKYDLPEIYVATDSRPALRDYFARVLEEVAAKGGQEVIYIDGLDQIEEDASGVRDLSFLPTRPPAGIVFVLGTRPNDTLQPLELRKPHQQYWLPPLSRADFDLVLQRRQVALSASLADRFYTVMEANALYLDLVARELAEAGALTPEQIIARIADNPENLFSLAVERLKRPALPWRETIKPILGLLLTAQAPLSAASLRALLEQDNDTVQDALLRLGGLLARDGEGRYTLFHLKLRDFLREDPQRLDKKYVFAADDEESYHQKLADWCERGGLACIWQEGARDAGEQERRAYARQHLITHLCRAQHWPRLGDVLDQGEYGRAKLRHDPSTRSFVLDLDTVRRTMVSMTGGDVREGRVWLPRLWQYSLLRCSLSSQADNYPEGLIELLAQLGREQEAIGLAEVLTDPKRKAATLVQIGEALGQQGRVVERQQLTARAVEVAREADNPGVGKQASVLAGVVEALARAERFDEARALAQQISDEGMRAAAQAGMIEALVKAERFDEVRVLAQQICDEGWRAEALAGVVVVLTGAEQFEEARALAQQISDEGRRAFTLAGVVEALARAERFDEACALALQIHSEGMRAEALAGVVEALARVERFDEACALVQEAADIARRLSNEGWRALALARVVEALARVKRFDEARTLAQEAADIARRLSDEGLRTEALARVVRALVKAERFDEARALVQQISDEGLRAFALARVVRALVKAERFDEARALAQQIHSEGRRVEALSGVVEALARVERFDEARALAQQISDEGRRAEALVGVVEVLAGAEQFEEAHALAQQISDEGRRVEALVGVVEALVKAERLDEALVLTQEAADIARRLSDESSRASALTRVVGMLVKVERFNEARALAQEAANIARRLSDEGSRTSALARVVGALVKAERFDEARPLTQQISGEGSRASALTRVVKVLAGAEQFEEARVLAQQISDEGWRAAALAGVVEALAQVERFDEARGLAQQISDEGRRAAALARVVEALARVERFDEARELAQEAAGIARRLSDEGSRAEALARVVEALVKAERLDEARAQAQQISDEGWRAAGLARVVEALARAERFDEARGLVQQISDEGWRAAALARVVEALARAERFDEARALAQQIHSEGRRAFALARVVEVLARAERFDEARALVQQIHSEGRRAAALAGVVEALARVERFDEARALAQQISDEGRRAAVLARVVEALARVERFDEARALAQQIHSEGRRAAALAGVVEVLARVERFDEARALAQQISHEDWQARALIVIAQRWAEIAHWDAVIRVISEVVTITIRQYDAISDFLSTLPHPPTVLILVQRLWSQATRRNDFYALLPAAAPLFVADPTLLSQILAGERWVQDQLKW